MMKMINNPYIGLDISTTSIGYFLMLPSGKPSYGLLSATDDKWEDRLKTLFHKTSELFDKLPLQGKTLVVSSAMSRMNADTAKKLSVIEGLISGIGFAKGLPVHWIGDNAWYNIIGGHQDGRKIKKETTLNYFCNKVLGAPAESYRWEGGTAKCFATCQGGIIADDVADAAACALLFDEVGNKRFIAQAQDFQKMKRIKIRKEIRTKKAQLATKKSDRKIKEQQKNLAFAEWELSQSKRDYGKFRTREKYLSNIDMDIKKIEEVIAKKQALLEELK